MTSSSISSTIQSSPGMPLPPLICQRAAGSPTDALEDLLVTRTPHEAVQRVRELNDAGFSAKLLAFMSDKAEQGPGHADDAQILRGLEILAAIPPQPRDLMSLLKFAKHANPKIRSKAIRVMGRICGNAGWIERNFSALDARVRANTLEALVENATLPEALRAEFLGRGSRDPHHRVATTALYFRAREGDEASRAQLCWFRDHGTEMFRRGAAWALQRLESEACLKGAVSASLPQAIAPESTGTPAMVS